MLAYPVRVLVVEATWSDVETGGWRGKITPGQVSGSLIAWTAVGLPVALVGNHVRAGKYVSRFLYMAARRRWRELRHLASAMHSETDGTDAAGELRI